MEENSENLTRRERRKLFREEKRDERVRKVNTGGLVKWAIILLMIAVLIYFLWWFVREVTKPLPGVEFVDLGRGHITDITDVRYNSDPPTSGPHFPVWAKKGVYDRVLSDGHLLHSLEHGYVVISYNCDYPTSTTYSYPPLTKMTVGVSGTMSFFTPDNPPPVEVPLPESFKSDECKKLVDNLWNTAKGWERVILVPRPGMDSKIALTAWRHLEKMNEFDEAKIQTFVSYYHNKGPEKTVE